ALGVKVDKIDKRVAVLEDGIGGWKIRGTFWFDANFTGGDNHLYTANGADTEFTKERFRLFITKQINENTSLYMQQRYGEDGLGNGRGDMVGVKTTHLYLDTKLPYDVNFRVGRFAVDFEGDYGFYDETDAFFSDYRIDGFQAKKSWGGLTATAIIGRNAARDLDGTIREATGNKDLLSGGWMNYVLDLHWQVNEKFFAGATGYWFVDDDTENLYNLNDDFGIKNYALYASYKFTPAVELMGIYNWQDNGDGAVVLADIVNGGNGTENKPKAWKAVLNLDQSLLKFTALRFEYMQQDNMYIGNRDYYGWGTDNSSNGNYAHVLQNMPWNDNTTKVFFVRADQKWNDKWSSFIRYTQAKFDTDGIDDAKEYGIAVKYQLNPAVAFRLGYDYVDNGENTGNAYNGDDHVIQFRTTVNF
ncbi:MAG: S-layer homology domain-containing protein, partial [Cloacibacillus sp.]